MMKRRVFYRVGAIVIVLIILYILLQIYTSANIKTTSRIKPSEDAVFAQLSSAYGVKKSWDGAKFAIYCKIFEPGKTLIEAEHELNKFGSEWIKLGDSYVLYLFSAGEYEFVITPRVNNDNIISSPTSVIETRRSLSQLMVCNRDSYSFF